MISFCLQKSQVQKPRFHAYFYLTLHLFLKFADIIKNRETKKEYKKYKKKLWHQLTQGKINLEEYKNKLKEFKW